MTLRTVDIRNYGTKVYLRSCRIFSINSRSFDYRLGLKVGRFTAAIA